MAGNNPSVCLPRLVSVTVETARQSPLSLEADDIGSVGSHSPLQLLLVSTERGATT